MSIVAHDDLVRQIRAPQVEPALTGYGASLRKASGQAAEVLLDQLGAEPEHAGPVQEIWPVALVFRGSVGPAPHA